MAAAGKKLLRSHVCVVKFRRVCEFVGVFLPSNNPSEGSSVCGWLFFCSLKITILGPSVVLVAPGSARGGYGTV